MRLALILLCVVIGGAVAYCGEPYIHENTDAVLIIVTVFTVFAGFLVAIITILGDPGLIPPGSWRTAESRLDEFEARLMGHSTLFVFYLLTIGLLFSGVMIRKAPVPGEIVLWIDRALLFFGVTAFLFTLALPGALWRYQTSRMRSEIERRRADAGIKPDETEAHRSR